MDDSWVAGMVVADIEVTGTGVVHMIAEYKVAGNLVEVGVDSQVDSWDYLSTFQSIK